MRFFLKKKTCWVFDGGLGAWNGIRTALEFFHHARASSYHPGSTSSSSFALSHSSCWSYRWFEYDVSYLIFGRCFKWFRLQAKNSPFHISVLGIICFSHLEILWSVQTKKGSYPFQVRRIGNTNILNFTCLLSRLSRHPASGVVCRHHRSTTFPIFFPSSTENARQQEF